MQEDLAVDLVYFDAGGGHRAAATALKAAIAEQQRPWRVRMVNLVSVLDPRRRFERLTGLAPEALYNKRLARGWTAGLAQELKLLQAMIRISHRLQLRLLQAHWERSRPDIVVSLIPNFNRVLCASLQATSPGVPFVTVMTDLADLPPHFWIEPDQAAQQLVCGTERAWQQARAAGVAPGRLHRVSGMVLRPDFHRPSAPDRAEARLALGLDAVRPTGVVMFGGEGSTAMLRIAQDLHDLPLILLCGRNHGLAKALRRQPAQAPRVVLEFTAEVPRYMGLGDYFIGKPGPGSLSEAVQSGLPVITVLNRWTMPQERYNADWVREHGLGLVHDSFRDLRPTVLQAIAQLPALRAGVDAMHNRAVYEVVELLERLALQSRGGDKAAPPPLAAA